ncbi:hypothetical protein [Actinokineospora sp.]|uniref:hypothetical protein n=1 Tax=Actinokineospora sp. TaxID=1872133 RepID=UPI00403815A5
MTDEIRGTLGPDGPPWSVDLLADLHAGVLDPQESARLWARVDADPDARVIIDALDSVKVGLGELSAAPAAPMPARFAASLDAALAAEAHRAFGGGVAVQQQPPPPAPVVDLAQARRKRTKRVTWGVGVLSAAAAAVAVTVVVIPAAKQTTGGTAAAITNTTPTPPAGSAEAPLAVTRDDIGTAAGKVGNTKEYGALKNQVGLDKCLTANGVDPAKAETIGVRPITLDGKPGIMALLTAGEFGKLRVVVVEPDCTALFNDTIGR